MKWRYSEETVMDVAAKLAGQCGDVDSVIVITQHKLGGLNMIYNSELQLQTAVYMLEACKVEMLTEILGNEKNDAANSAEAGD